jgi:serine/threonine protein kinase
LADYAPNGTLKEKRYDMDLLQLSKSILDVARGLRHIHSRGYVHGDIQACHIFLYSNYEPLIAIFGFCQDCDQIPDEVRQLPQQYVAPEVADKTAEILTEKTDVFVFGEVLCDILENENYLDLPDTFLLFQLAEWCRMPEPSDRPTFADICRRLEVTTDGYEFADENLQEGYVSEMKKYKDKLDAAEMVPRKVLL